MNNILGVGLLLFNKNGGLEIFTIQELKSKRSICKEVGMISFPLETFKEEDVNAEGTITRLLKEEAGILSEEVVDLFVVPERFRLIPGRCDIVTAYGFGRFSGNLNQPFQPKDNDIKFAGWRTINDLLSSYVRIEVAPIVEHFLGNYLNNFLAA